MLRHASYEIFVAKNYNKHSHVGSYSERDNWSQTGALADSAEIIQYRYTLYASGTVLVRARSNMMVFRVRESTRCHK